MFTATHQPGQPTIFLHREGCQHALNPDTVVGIGATATATIASAMNVCDPDNDHPGVWRTAYAPCAHHLMRLEVRAA